MNRRSLTAVVAIAVGLALAPACRKLGKLAARTETSAAGDVVASEFRSAHRLGSAFEAEARAGYLREIPAQAEVATDLHKLNSPSSFGHGGNSHDGASPHLGATHVAIDPVKAAKEERERELRPIAQRDEAAARGEIDAAERSYIEASTTGVARQSESVDATARNIISDLAKGTTSNVVADLARLSASPLDLSPAVRTALLAAIKQRSSQAAFQHVERTLGTSAVTASEHFGLVSLDNTLVTLRDVAVDQRHASLPWGIDLSTYTVVIDDRLRTGYEGMLHHLGGNAARWRKPKNVRIELLEEIDQLPDVVHETTTGVFARPLRRGKGIRKVVGPLVLVRLCDHGNQTENPRDAC